MDRQPPAGKQRSRPSGRAGARQNATGPPAARQDAAPGQDAYLQAVAVYQRAVEALQRRHFRTAASQFKRVIEKFPDELEIHERSRRYLAVCERESLPSATPKSLEDRLFAATLALNSGSQGEALRHLKAAAKEQPDSDHVQYMLAVARADAGDAAAAATHLLRAIELNPDNRFLARTEPSFEPLREDAAVQEALKTPGEALREPDTGSPSSS